MLCYQSVRRQLRCCKWKCKYFNKYFKSDIHIPKRRPCKNTSVFKLFPAHRNKNTTTITINEIICKYFLRIFKDFVHRTRTAILHKTLPQNAYPTVKIFKAASLTEDVLRKSVLLKDSSTKYYGVCVIKIIERNQHAWTWLETTAMKLCYTNN